MCSKPSPQDGFSLVEMIVTLVLFGVMAAVGSLLIGKIAPSYMVNVQAEQALSPREAALWRLSEDFRRSLIEGTSQIGCTLNLTVASGVTGANSATVASQTGVYQWFPGSKQLWLSAPWISSVSGVLLDNVTAPSGCPFNYVSGIGTASRAHLNVAFQYSAGGYESVVTPVSMALYSYANGPYAASIFPVSAAVGSTVNVTIRGIFPGLGMGIISSVVFTAPVTKVFTGIPTSSAFQADISSVAPVTVNIRVTTTEGWSLFTSAFSFQ